LTNGQEIPTLTFFPPLVVTIDNNGVMINNAMVTVADIVTDNGVIHVIDAVLLPQQPSFVSNGETIGSVDVYPNPANDQLNIIMAGEASDNISITIQDMTGKTIMVVSQLEMNKVNKLNVSELSKGVYLMRIRTGAGDRTEKLIIQ
jgi:hypothetical protein